MIVLHFLSTTSPDRFAYVMFLTLTVRLQVPVQIMRFFRAEMGSWK
jgi:hypothetical protein